MFLMFVVCCFPCKMIRKLFSHLSFKAINIDRFFSLSVTYGIFTLRFSLNQMFVITFSVSFGTDRVEKTTPSHVTDNKGLRSTKKESNRTPIFSNGKHASLEIPVVMMEKLYPCSFKCLTCVAVMACMRLSPLLFFPFCFFFSSATSVLIK